MRYLLIGVALAALLSSSSAWAGSASVPMLVKAPSSGSSSIACDIGPNYTGSIPGPARAEGYTHCVANYDFTNTTTWNNNASAGGSGFNFSTLSTWFQCSDDGSGGYIFYLDTGGVTPPCTDVHMITDGGVQVLDLTFTPTDFTNNVKYISLISTSRFNYPTPAGTLFPNGLYVEDVYRIPSSTYSSLSVDPGGVLIGGSAWTYGLGGSASPQTNVMEWDFGEQYANSSGGYEAINVGEHCPSNFQCGSASMTGQQASGWNPQAYQAYQRLETTDTSGNYGECAYLNGTPITYTGVNGCVTGTFAGGSSDAALNSKNQLIQWTGAQQASETCQNQACAQPSGNVDMYIKRITIWSCPSWQTTTNGCAVSAVPTSPPSF